MNAATTTKTVTTTVRGIPDLMSTSLISVNREGYQSTVFRPCLTTGVLGRYETNEWRAYEQETELFLRHPPSPKLIPTTRVFISPAKAD